MGGIALWITGLPGSGKSTLADAVKAQYSDFRILRMDELRKIVTPDPSYSDFEREIVYRSLVYLAKMMTELGHDVIIDATGNKRRWRRLARQLIPAYIEVYLRCSLEECLKREEKRKDTLGAPEDIYLKGEQGWPVPGVNVPYEEPDSPELVIDSDRIPLPEAVSLMSDFLKQRLSGR